ncbi:MAG: hypothetical protein NTW25_12560 [Candidatus Kapabacteria bacterium]|nr:hypothetical protein [Candidatus Kapabacteria bacterium]
MIKRKIIFLIIIILSIIAIQACVTNYYFRYVYKDANSLLRNKNINEKYFLKAHLKNGDVCILRDTWKVDTLSSVLIGKGERFDFKRNIISEGDISIPFDSIAIYETNKKIVDAESSRLLALGIIDAFDVVGGLLCLTHPKYCFGSCPTFYLNENDNFHFANAEGFSNAISPSMEYTDIDALNNGTILNNIFSLTMKNEALETHCVNSVNILAFPRKKRERVYNSPKNKFFLCENLYLANLAKVNNKDITQNIKIDDRYEYFSPSDIDNLKSKEEIYLTYENVNNSSNLGLLVNFRQTLMTTYFIYNAIGYMGDEVSDIFAKFESNCKIATNIKDGIKNELGDIELYLWDDNSKSWTYQDSLYETGPIAINRQILPLKSKSNNSTINLKIVLNKGLWRIDYLALTNFKKEVEPIEISPSGVLNNGKNDDFSLGLLKNPNKYLISMPGSEYRFHYVLPKNNQDYELFLSSKGYYLEWMRKDWLQEKDLFKLYTMFENPKKYLKDEAHSFKLYESRLEKEFWDSKIDKKKFSYYAK